MPGIISIEGNIGSGKSTLLSLLDVPVIPEPVSQWTNTAGNNILEDFYKDPKRWAFTFQLNALYSRVQLWRKTLQDRPDQLYFSERSPMADRHIFGEIMGREGNMATSQFAIYDRITQTLMDESQVKAYIYLKCDPKTCQERIKKRNRKGEEGIPLSYLQKVHERHQDWIGRQKGVKVLTIDTGVYDVENPQDLSDIMAQIKGFLANCN